MGADNPGVFATYQFQANVTGGAGSAGTAGGWYLTAAYQTAAAAAGTPATAGTGIYRAQVYTPYATVIGNNTPLAWWQLADASGSDTAADSSGNNHQGAAVAVSFGDTNEAVLGYTSALYGTTSTITTTYNPGLAGVTVEGWVNLDGLTQYGTPVLMASSQTSTDHKGFELQISGGTDPSVTFGNSTASATVTGGTAVPANGWTYIAGTMGGGAVILYVNGVTTGAATLTGNMASGTAAGIGLGFNPGSNAGNLNGLLAQCAIYGSVLTSSQIFAHYQSGLSGVPIYTGNGVMQAQGTAATACSYFADLLNVGAGSVNTWQPGVLVADHSATTRTPPSDGTDTSGLTSRVTWVWAGVTTGGSTVTQVPAPQQTWTAAITTAQLNGPTGPKQALQFLNNPPLFKVAQGLTSAVAGSALSSLTFGSAPTVDTYTGWNGTTQYTAQLPGLYLAAPLVSFAANSSGERFAGLAVAGTNGTTTLQGGAYPAINAAAGATAAGQIRVLDLQAGDTVTLQAGQTSGSSLNLAGTAGTTRLVLAYLCPYSAGGVASATPPYTPFRWQAGITASQLPSLLSQHLGNDLSFLVNRPFFTGYQGSAQTGFLNGTWNAVTIDTPGGIIHGSNGDNYAGWSASQNAYVAQQPGWYLCLFEGYATVPGSVSPGPYLTAGFNVPTSGGVPPLTSPDWYQSMYVPATFGAAPGVSAIGSYYLQAGETVQPMLRAQNWAGSWGTYVSAVSRSQLTCLWIAE